MNIKIQEDEYWWYGAVIRGHFMPFSLNSLESFSTDNLPNGDTDQFAPLLISSHGRYIWSEEAFDGEIKDGTINLFGKADFILSEDHKTLKDAYLAAMANHFPFSHEIPHEDFFKKPQYNTWVDLGHNQTQDGILSYAKDIVKNGLPAGILMIDGGWQEDYGVFEFNRRKIPEPKKLIDELHNMGFKVMVWVSPIVASAGARYKELRDKGYLIKDSSGEIAIRRWWSGYSAVLDFTNPGAEEWFHSQLQMLMDNYDIDGFKFDAGDRYFYDDNDVIYKPTYAKNQTMEFNRVGSKYKFNEFRAAWKYGGKPIVARLHDKKHSWYGDGVNHTSGLNMLIPHTILQGLCGYAYACPDMVGGGCHVQFAGGGKVDEELFVRWAQANALLGMMQISVSPWKILSQENNKHVMDAIKLHTEFGDLIYELAKNASRTGEPIVRHMAYEFPGENLECISDQFMLGSDVLVAPVIQQGAKKRKVILPRGRWKYYDGTVYDGGSQIELNVNISTIPYFYKQ